MTTWIDQANCKGVDTELFFPGRGEAHLVIKQIRELCGNCLVAKQCLEYGLQEEIQIGYYGGKSAKERCEILSVRHRQKRKAS